MITLLSDSIRGKARLWKAFWIGSILPVIAVPIISICIFFKFFQMPFDYSSLYYFIFISILFTIVTTFAIWVSWKCSHNCNSKLWTYGIQALILLVMAHQLYYGTTIFINDLPKDPSVIKINPILIASNILHFFYLFIALVVIFSKLASEAYPSVRWAVGFAICNVLFILSTSNIELTSKSLFVEIGDFSYSQEAAIVKLPK